MRNLLLLLAIGLAGYGGYLYWEEHHKTANPKGDAATDRAQTEPAAKQESAVIPAPVAPSIAAVPAVPEAPAKRAAPDGVFYAMQAFSITTDAGVRGIRAGTQVKLIKDAGATLRVSDGQQEFDVRRELLTNDLDVAAKAAGQQASQQAGIAEWHRKQQTMAAANQQQNETAAAMTQELVRENAEIARAAAEQRRQRMVDIRAQIASEEAAKQYTPIGLTRQKHLNDQNEKIRLLQLELGRLGVAGASLERK